MNIALEGMLAKLPIAEIKGTIQKHIKPLEIKLPDKRLGRVVEDMVMGIMGGETAVITEIARQNSKEDGESWGEAKRMYRLLENEHIETRELYEGLYAVGRQAVAQEAPEYLVVAVDPVNFEKPYVKAIEGANIVHTLDRMHRLFAIVLLSAQMVFVIAFHWPPKAVLCCVNSVANWASPPIVMALIGSCMAFPL